MMKNAFWLVLLFSAHLLGAQSTSVSLNEVHICSFSESPAHLAVLQDFTSNAEAQAVMNDIMNVIGLRSNFKIQAADVPNAAAVVIGTTRFIYYNPGFIQSVRQGTRTNWSAISILAHEIGHHLQGHTLTNLGSRPATELEADEFSGFVCRKMGASLDQSQAAMRLLASPYGSATHPGKDSRLAAIEKGWRQADEQFGGSSQEPSVSEQETPIPPGGESLSFAIWKVRLEKNPQSDYYITRSNNFVLLRNGKLYTLGKFRSIKNENYPYVIKMKDTPDIVVSKNGELLSLNGNNIGSLERM